MKRVIFILMFALALFSCKSYKPASGNPDYRPLKSFNKDTLAYFNYNFEVHKDFYIGKKFSVLVNDVENDPTGWISSDYVIALKKNCMTGASLFTEPEMNAAEQYDDEISVSFADTSYVYADDFWDRERLVKSLDPDISRHDLQRKRRDFVSDCIVSDISVVRLDMRKGAIVRQDRENYREYLQNGEWERFCDYKKFKDRQTVRFTKDSVCFQNGDVKDLKPYYLTWKWAENIIDFNDEFVGKNDEWRTIVIKGHDGNPVAFTIFEISDDVLKLREYKTKELWYFRKVKSK